ncbi:MAG: HAD family hydrolase [Candidatus Hodarchaeales archaeon]
MNDNSKRGEHWKRLIAEYFVPLYGGLPEKWEEANHRVVQILVKKVEQLIDTGINQDYEKFQAFEDELWINYMFDSVGIERPPKRDYFGTCREVEQWIIPQIQAEIEGIVEVIKKLKSEGFTLHTASGETSWVLRGYLTRMGIEDCFTNLYGPDIVGVMKGGLGFYRRIFVHARVNPQHAIVIDDNPKILQLAGHLGTHTIQSCVLKESIPNSKYYYNDPAELPEIIRGIASI